jgi:hypothetical protein
MSALISSEWNDGFKKAIEELKDKDDSFSNIRDALLEKDIGKIFGSIK